MKRDRIIGYISLTALVAFGAFCISLIIQTVFLPVEHWRIRFNNVMTLRIEDPVRIDGMDVAQVTAIQYHKGQAIVTAAFPTPPVIYANYAIAAVDVGVMGERLITLYSGTPEARRLTKRDTLVGEFVKGPSEALGVFSTLSAIVTKLTIMSIDLLEGTPEKASLINQYRDFAFFVDSIGQKIEVVVRTLDRELGATLSKTDKVLSGAQELTAVAGRQLPAVTDTLAMVMNKADSALSALEGLTADFRGVLGQLEGEESKRWEELLDKAATAAATVRTTLDNLYESGLPLKVLP